MFGPAGVFRVRFRHAIDRTRSALAKAIKVASPAACVERAAPAADPSTTTRDAKSRSPRAARRKSARSAARAWSCRALVFDSSIQRSVLACGGR
jgi:hypothetical protein